MQRIRTDDFSMKHTVESAQPLTFFGDISADGRHLRYVAGNSLVEVRQNDGLLYFGSQPTLSGTRLRKEIAKRFGLQDDMGRIYEKIGTDEFLANAIARYPGMRVTRNDPWETTVCFIVSQFNNVKRIRLIVRKLIENYGELHSVDVGGKWVSFRSFPTPDALAGIGVKEMMKKCGTGFRAKYIIGSARTCSESLDLNRLHHKDYHRAKEQIMELPGVGDKVADCIMLMGYGKLEAFPIDTWIKRIVERVYFDGKKQGIKKIHEFADERWGDYAGYAQQYLFWAGRSLKIN
ncbi:MAG: hypothetical protein KGH78_02790 [Candidatus Micrarchaeota archaeon]|nr:hypothetical protein [Candidatus Micrarchaeota archaeon]MDE1847075.1 hypothetical protein [Candidatus Micrarchaeota archaeon]